MHKLHITVAVEGAHLFTCDNRTALQAMLPLEETDVMASKLLPLTKEWMLTGSIMALNMFHPTIDGHVRHDHCQATKATRTDHAASRFLRRPDRRVCARVRCREQLDLTISRSFLVFFVKMMLTSVIVVSGSLITALYMHPEEHANRCNVLFIAFLILVYNMQVDLGLGAITQLLWLDVFNIVQSCLVLVAVGESTIVHLLLKGKQDSLAISIDRVLRVTIPFVLYPLTTLALILWGLDQWSLCPDTEACGVSTTDPLWADRSKLLHGWTMSEVDAYSHHQTATPTITRQLSATHMHRTADSRVNHARVADRRFRRYFRPGRHDRDLRPLDHAPLPIRRARAGGVRHCIDTHGARQPQ